MRWRDFQYETNECELRIPPQEQREIDVAKFIFLLQKSYDQNSPTGAMGLYFCKNPNHPKPNSIEPLGLYKIKVSIKYKRGNDDEVRTKVFDGYIYASIKDRGIGATLGENDIRDRLECEAIIDSGDPMKNKDIPKPRERQYEQKIDR